LFNSAYSLSKRLSEGSTLASPEPVLLLPASDLDRPDPKLKVDDRSISASRRAPLTSREDIWNFLGLTREGLGSGSTHTEGSFSVGRAEVKEPYNNNSRGNLDKARVTITLQQHREGGGGGVERGNCKKQTNKQTNKQTDSCHPPLITLKALITLIRDARAGPRKRRKAKGERRKAKG
jgi:hypothetical protein